MLQLPLYDEVKQFFPYHRKELVKTFILFTQCVFQSRTVSLYKNRSEAGSATGKKTFLPFMPTSFDGCKHLNLKSVQ